MLKKYYYYITNFTAFQIFNDITVLLLARNIQLIKWRVYIFLLSSGLAVVFVLAFYSLLQNVTMLSLLDNNHIKVVIKLSCSAITNSCNSIIHAIFSYIHCLSCLDSLHDNRWLKLFTFQSSKAVNRIKTAIFIITTWSWF